VAAVDSPCLLLVVVDTERLAPALARAAVATAAVTGAALTSSAPPVVGVVELAMEEWAATEVRAMTGHCLAMINSWGAHWRMAFMENLLRNGHVMLFMLLAMHSLLSLHTVQQRLLHFMVPKQKLLSLHTPQ
jgi:hypothetical protein